MRFEMEFNMDNAAFGLDPADEAGIILRQTADRVADGNGFAIMDNNGNKIGAWKIIED